MMKRKLVKLALVGVVVGAGITLGAGPATAQAGNCQLQKGYGANGWTIARCYGGEGYYRAIAYCADNPQGTIGLSRFVGDWRHSTWTDGNSMANCNGNKYLIDGGYELA